MTQPSVPTEAQEAAVLVAYLRIKGYKFHHSPNETGHTPDMRRRAIRVKREGTSKGFIDYVVLTVDGMKGIELKRKKGSVTSPEQVQWVKMLNLAGVETIVAKGAEEAINFISKYKPLREEVLF